MIISNNNIPRRYTQYFRINLKYHLLQFHIYALQLMKQFSLLTKKGGGKDQ